jgi:hypothetical protein
LTTNVILNSFASGELSPSLYARVDLAKYKAGAALLRNFFVDYRGGVSNRPGTRFIAQSPSAPDLNVRLIRFQFSTLQAYMLEFGNFYMRVYMDGGLVLHPAAAISSISQSNPAVVTQIAHGFTNGDQIYFSGVNGMTEVNGRVFLITVVDPNSYNLFEISGGNINSTGYGAYVSGGTAAKAFLIETPWGSNDLPKLKFTQSADVMTLVHPDYPPYDLTRTDHDNWTLAEVNFNPSIATPTGVAVTTTAVGPVYYSYLVTAIDADGNESAPSAVVTVASVDLTNSTTPPTITVTWSSVNGASFYRVYKTFRTTRVPTAATSSAYSSSQFGLLGATVGISFEDANIAPDFATRPPNHADPFGPSPITNVTVVSGGSGITTADTISITDAFGSGAVLLPIISGGVLQHVSVISGGRDYAAPTISMTSGGVAPVLSATLGEAVGNNPSAVTYFEQRKVYAATLNEPQRFWMSQPGLYTNFDVTDPVKADDSISAVLASTQVNAIKSMLSMPSGLIMLTAGGAWQVSGGAQGASVTPTTVSAKAQSYNGVSDLEPIVINFDILYVQTLGSIVRDLSYNYFANVYTGSDITVLSNHFFYGYTLQQWAWAEEPYKIVWAVRDDGRALALTFLKEQEVYGWTLHETDGLFEDVATVGEGAEQSVYFVARRWVNGISVKYIEILHTRQFSSIEEAWFVDCGLELPLTIQPDALGVEAATGNGVLFLRSSALFSAGDVGKVIRSGGGVATVVAYNSPTSVTCNITVDITATHPETGVPIAAGAGAWSMTSPVSTIAGLEHLEGLVVAVLADGVPMEKIVSAGKITLTTPASRVIVGLPYTAKFQTLKLDTGEPTIQGKRKKISAVTLRVDKTRGLRVGPTFNELTVIKQEAETSTFQAISGDEYLLIDPTWNEEGQICAQQDYPLPATILGVIPEITVGDT